MYGRGHSTVAVRSPSTAKPSHFWQQHGCEGSFSQACPKCGWRGTEESSEKAAGFWQHGGLCTERQCRAAEMRRKKKENDTTIEAEIDESWVECDLCQKWRLLPSTCIVADGAPFQCADAHLSCEDAGDDEKDEEELDFERPRRTSPEAASAAISADLFTSAAFSSASMPVTPPTVRKQHVVPGTHCQLAEAQALIRRIKRNLHNQKTSAQRMKSTKLISYLEHPSLLPDSTNCDSKFGNKFDGRMKIKHLIQVHIQMKAIELVF